MKRFILGFLFVASALLPHGASARPVVWVGTGIQTERGAEQTRWTIRLAFNRTGNSRITYPSLGCGGTLIHQHQVGRVYVFRERIRYGRAVCVDRGTVRIIVRGNRLNWRWTGERTRYSDLRARATLRPLRHRHH